MQLRVNSLYICSGIALSILMMVFAIGMRPHHVGSDTIGYIEYYNHFVAQDLGALKYDYLFLNIRSPLSFLGFSSSGFLTFFALINFLNISLLSKNLANYLSTVGSYRLFLILLSSLCISPFFLCAQVNVLRQGVAIFILFIYYLLLLERKSLFLLMLFAVLAQGFHHTSILFILFSFLIYFRYSLVICITWAVACCYVLGITQYLIHLFSPSIYEHIMSYGVDSGYQLGIRYSFVLFTLGAGLSFHLLGKYLLPNIEQGKFFSLLKVYWLLTLPFFFLGFGTYSDRFLLPAWIYLSIICAVFIGLTLKRWGFSIYGYYLVFFLTSNYFILRAQGIIG